MISDYHPVTQYMIPEKDVPQEMLKRIYNYIETRGQSEDDFVDFIDFLYGNQERYEISAGYKIDKKIVIKRNITIDAGVFYGAIRV